MGVAALAMDLDRIKAELGVTLKYPDYRAGLAALLLYGVVTAMRFYSADQSDVKPLIAYAKAPEEIIPVEPSTEDSDPLQSATDNNVAQYG